MRPPWSLVPLSLPPALHPLEQAAWEVGEIAGIGGGIGGGMSGRIAGGMAEVLGVPGHTCVAAHTTVHYYSQVAGLRSGGSSPSPGPSPTHCSPGAEVMVRKQ